MRAPGRYALTGKRTAVPFPEPLSLPSPSSVAVLRKCLDEAEHLLHNRRASVASLRSVFGIIPEPRSPSLRNGVHLKRNPQAERTYG